MLTLCLSLFALLLAGPIACKKAQPDQQPHAQDQEAVQVEAADATGGSAASVEKLHGAWLIDHEATIAQLPEDQQQMAGAFMKMMKIGIIFKADETVVMRVSMMEQKDEQEGSYKVLDAIGNSLIVELSRGEVINEDGELVQEESSQMIVTFLNNDEISFKPIAEEGESQAELDEETLILKRVSEDELNTHLDEDNDAALD